MKKIFISIVIMLLTASTALCTDYYVRKDGHDSCDGLDNIADTGSPWSVSCAWLTMQHAADTVPDAANHTINVGTGTYAENVDEGRSGVSPGYRHWLASGTVTVSGTGSRGIEITNDWVKVDGFTFSGQIDSSVRTLSTADNNVIINCTLITADANIGGTNNTLQDSTLKEYTEDFIRLYGSGHIIRGNYLYDAIGDGSVHQDAIQTYYSSASYPGASNVTIENNHFFMGCKTQAGTNCDIGELAEQDNDPAGDAYAIIEATNNDNSNDGWIIRNNIFESSGHINFADGVDGVEVYNNIFRSDYNLLDVGTGFSVRDSGNDIVVKNNMFINTKNGIKLLGTPTNVDCQDNFYWRADSGTTKNENMSPGTGDVTNQDPLFSSYSYNIYDNPSGYVVTAGSPAIDVGSDIGNGLTYGLDSSSTWPGGIVERDQDDYGDGWEMGAYVFDGESYGESSGGVSIN